MLVYCCNLSLRPTGGVEEIFSHIGRWLGRKSNGYVNPAELLGGTRLRLKDESIVETATSRTQTDESAFPLLACVRLSHGDSVPGRQWVTEIGVHQSEAGGPVQCSVLLQTNEISARVTSPIQVTRPRIVDELIMKCGADISVPGLKIQQLTENNADSFLRYLEHADRKYPCVIMSSKKDGTYYVSPPRLQSIVRGLADIIVIPKEEDTFAIEKILGTRYAAWLGAISIIFPARVRATIAQYDTIKLIPDALSHMIDEQKSVEAEVLSLITHRTNLPNSWKHISLASVAYARLRKQLAESIARAQTSEADSEYIELLEAANAELIGKDTAIRDAHEQILQMSGEIEGVELENRQLQNKIEALEFGLKKKEQTAQNSKFNDDPTTREALVHVYGKSATLEHCLIAISALFPDRVSILPSALSSARASASFELTDKAFSLLYHLCNEYWSALANGKADAQAKSIFGASYAAKESSKLSKDGRKRRTFTFDDTPIEMNKHLKVGVADNKSDTLRIHFEWIAEKKLIVIGHCGGHLDF